MSGIQILIIFAGLQSISPSIYEAANVEGASGWEKYWLITFPMVSPVLLLSVVYTIIDSFTAFNNWVVVLIKNTMFGKQEFATGSAMSFIYFAIVSTFVGLVILIGNKVVFYYDKK
jgi:ABC-type sugar transport system permease subunit